MTEAIPAAPSCADDHDPMSLTVQDALARILANVAPVCSPEPVPVAATLGRILAADIVSTMNVPAHTNSAMDGYALSGSDIPARGTGELEVIGTAFAGRPYLSTVARGQCVRIMTGAPLPPGTDTVVMQERVGQRGDRIIRIDGNLKAGDNVRQAGEDIREGQTVLAAGRRLMPADIGLIASLGIAEVAVHRPLRVAIFSTGDELRPVDERLGPGDVHDSNRYTLRGMLQRLGAQIKDVGIVRDTPEHTRAAFQAAAAGQDAIISSGGVSVGEADFVKQVLSELGHAEFWKVAMKPGRPLTFGRVRGAVFFGLPGNPVSVMVTFYQFVQPALRRMMGETQGGELRLRATSASRLKKRPGRVEFQRGVLGQDEGGALVVRKTGMQGSGILTSMSHANCFIILPQDCAGVEIGDPVEVQPFAGLI
ncbi:MAG: Molybdopterin molybdenumtransferase [Gammaproteobacteria bacterium]|nr:Molybdopterin molybdenumtransferase [Gammaproteobacteria bacterium]